jgi:hypothetical protein
MRGTVLIAFASWLALAYPASAQALPPVSPARPENLAPPARVLLPRESWQGASECVNTHSCPLRFGTFGEPYRQYDFRFTGPLLGKHVDLGFEKREYRDSPIPHGDGVEYRATVRLRF